MSKLADLLNPAPSGASSTTTRRPPPIDASRSIHRRNESITSPLEALALAATTAPPLQLSPTAITPSTTTTTTTTIPPNPYAIKSHFSAPPTASTISQPPPANPYATSQSKPVPPQSLSHEVSSARSPRSPAKQTSPPAVQEPQISSDKSVVKTEQTVTSSNTSATTAKALASGGKAEKMNGTPPASLAPEKADVEMKEDVVSVEPSAEVKPSVETAPPVKKPVKKKGMAKKPGGTGERKAMPKKRKLDANASKDGTPFSQRSDTPASRISKTPARRHTPHQSSPALSQDNASVADEDDEEEGEGEEYVDENEVFCICRKPDDHTWMIGCDGGCDDWFHGRCIKMKESDGDLIVKYVCQSCDEAGRGKTMWKPMCRLQGCRKPARVSGKKPSKYCSDEHGQQFMRGKAYAKNGARGDTDNSTRKRRKQDKVEEDQAKYNEASSDDGHQAHLRGGVVKPGELKALVSGSKGIDQFKQLGARIVTPDTNNTIDQDGDVTMGDDDTADDGGMKLNFSTEDQAKLDDIGRRKAAYEKQLSWLRDKEKFLQLVKNRRQTVLEDLKKTENIKDICGYDSRLTWSEPEFDDWRQSEEGKLALDSGKLGPAPKKEHEGSNGTAKAEDDEIGRGTCKKKRCERHKTWQRTETSEVMLARSQCHHQMRKLDDQLTGVKERAMLRQLEAAR